MWMWTLDAKLINLAQVESIELLEVYPDESDPEEIESGALEPDYLELVAFLASGRDALLFDSEDLDSAHQAYEIVASFVAREGVMDGISASEPVSVEMLLERARNAKN